MRSMLPRQPLTWLACKTPFAAAVFLSFYGLQATYPNPLLVIVLTACAGSFSWLLSRGASRLAEIAEEEDDDELSHMRQGVVVMVMGLCLIGETVLVHLGIAALLAETSFWAGFAGEAGLWGISLAIALFNVMAEWGYRPDTARASAPPPRRARPASPLRRLSEAPADPKITELEAYVRKRIGG